MRLINRYIGKSIFVAICAVLLVIVALDSISAIVDQLDNLTQNYNFFDLLVYVVLYIPSTMYEYLPLSCLVGCLVGLGALASSSELTIIRSAGVSVAQIIIAVMKTVAVFIVLGLLIGEFVAPYLNQYAESRRSLSMGKEKNRQVQEGVWNRESNEFMHFAAVLSNGKLYGVSHYHFDDNSNLKSTSYADSAIFQGDHWIEQGVVVTDISAEGTSVKRFKQRRWDSDVSPNLLNILVLEPDELPMTRLFNYSNYLKKQSLDASVYRLSFWQKAFQPLAIASLVMIAISFILGPLRQTTMGYRVFIGVIAGLIFQTVQKLLGPSSIILGFPPFLAVLIPIVFCALVGFFLLRKSQ